MKKMVVLILFVFVSSVCFAGYPQNEGNPHARREQAFIDSFNQAKETQEKLLSLEVGKETQKEFDLLGTYNKIGMLSEKLNMGSYDLIFSKANGKLKVEAKLHDGEKTFPSHILVFDRKSLGWTEMNTGSNFEIAESFSIKMNLLTAEKVLVSTYTLARTW